MAHTYGNATTLATAATDPIVSASYTPTAGSTVVVLMLLVGGATDRAGGAPSYNGVAMTQADVTRKGTTSPEASTELWYIAGVDTPSSGTFSIPNTGLLSIDYVGASALAGATMTSAFDVAIGSAGVSTNPTTTALTPTVNGAIIFACCADGAQTWAPSAQTGTNIYTFDSGTFGGSGQYLLQATAGSQAMSWTFGTSEDWGAVGVAFKEVAVASGANQQGTLMGVG